MHEKNKKSNRQQSLTINSTENQSILSGHYPKNPKIVRETPQPNTNESRYGSQLAKLKLRKPLCKNEERPQQIGNHFASPLCHTLSWLSMGSGLHTSQRGLDNQRVTHTGHHKTGRRKCSHLSSIRKVLNVWTTPKKMWKCCTCRWCAIQVAPCDVGGVTAAAPTVIWSIEHSLKFPASIACRTNCDSTNTKWFHRHNNGTAMSNSRNYFW